ncbi:DUF2681 domain-containing protein [Aggregatibacter kilianii]|nr:MAG TPA: Protein of unknown function (DUF2681) [Caudoviricetes sp.]
MTLYFILGAIGAVVLIGGYITVKLKAANREINKLLKQNETLQAEKAVVQTQVKHFETRKKNEKNSRNTDRDALIERLHQSGDLRD